MTNLAKREELIHMKLSEFRDFVNSKREDINDCSIDVDCMFSYSVMNDSGILINHPTGERKVKIRVLFDTPCSEDTQSNIVEAIKEFVRIIQEGLERGKIEVYKFITSFNADYYAQLETDYASAVAVRENQDKLLTD
jgi:hypothetical protein